LPHRAESRERAAGAHPRRPQRGGDPAGGGGGDLPAGHLWWDAGGRRGPRRLQGGARGARRMAAVAAPRHPAVVAAVEAARAAGQIAMRYYRGGFEVMIKPDQPPVTQADREAEETITAILRRAFPDVGFLGEEFGQQGPTDRRWIIDPID